VAHIAVFRVERTNDYTIMVNHHLRNRSLSLKAIGLLSQMLSLPEDWDYTLRGQAIINEVGVDRIRKSVNNLKLKTTLSEILKNKIPKVKFKVLLTPFMKRPIAYISDLWSNNEAEK
jgi:hypothetical protein